MITELKFNNGTFPIGTVTVGAVLTMRDSIIENDPPEGWVGHLVGLEARGSHLFLKVQWAGASDIMTCHPNNANLMLP